MRHTRLVRHFLRPLLYSGLAFITNIPDPFLHVHAYSRLHPGSRSCVTMLRLSYFHNLKHRQVRLVYFVSYALHRRAGCRIPFEEGKGGALVV